MKRKQVIFAILFFVGISTYAQDDENGNYFQTNKKERDNLKSTKSLREIPNYDFQFDSIRPLTELNNSLQADAYPWISNNGLNLYYISEDLNDNVDKLVHSSRSNINEFFSTPQTLSINSSVNDNSSPWLTEDELDIYFIIRKTNGTMWTTLYHAERSSTNEDFSNKTIVNLLGDISGNLFSPSLTMDMEKLYIYNSNSDTQNILIFDKVVDNEYQLVDTLNIPDGYKPGPGKIGQDDLKYYLPLTDIDKNVALYVYNRESIEDSFDSVYYLNNEIINNSEFRNVLSSISKDGNYFVFVRSSDDSWSSTDLYIAYKKARP